MSDEGRGGGSELVSDLSLDLDLYLDRDPESCKILWIWIRPNDADPLDPDPQHCLHPPGENRDHTLPSYSSANLVNIIQYPLLTSP